MTSKCQLGKNLLLGYVCMGVIAGEWDVSGMEPSSFRAFLPRKEKSHMGGSQGNTGMWRRSQGGLRRGGCCQAARDSVLQWHRASQHL